MDMIEFGIVVVLDGFGVELIVKYIFISPNEDNMSTTKYLVTAIVRDKRGRKLSSAFNSYFKTHPRQKELAHKVGYPHKQFLHAEVLAIIRAQRVGIPYSIEVIRTNEKTPNVLRCSEPCGICKQAIREAGIQKVIYTP